jgi:nucleoid DNA-binding protein
LGVAYVVKKINFVYMRVEDYIKQLLYRYECVIVPGFGAFVTQFSSAQYLSESHRFIPPTRTVTFNKSIQNHDGLLAETIAKGESMDFESAKHKIHLFVNDFKTALQANKELEIPQLGMFFLDEEEKLSFEPQTEINYFISAFGLDTVSFTSVSQPAKVNQEKTESEAEVKNITSSSLSENQIEEKPKKRAYLKYAAVGVVAISLASFAGLYQYNNYLITHNDSEAQKAETLLQQRIQNAEFSYSLSELPLLTEKIETTQPKYHIVAGAFRVQSNAIKKIELLKGKGYDARMIDKNAYGLYQVAFASYTDKSRALMQLRKIKSIENPQAWLYVKQL